MNNKPKYQRALDWVNRQRAKRDLEPITEWPANLHRKDRREPFVNRCCGCPVAMALGSGWTVYCSTAESPDNVSIELPRSVQKAVRAFDDALSRA